MVCGQDVVTRVRVAGFGNEWEWQWRQDSRSSEREASEGPKGRRQRGLVELQK